MADGAIVPSSSSTPAAKPKKAPEFGRPLDLPGDGNAGWTVSGVDRYGEVLLTRPSGQGIEKHSPIPAQMYERLVKAPNNQKKVFIKPKFKLEQPFSFDKGFVSAQAHDGHTNRTLVTGIVNGEPVQEWIDAKLLNTYFTNPEAARAAMMKRFGLKPDEGTAEKTKKETAVVKKTTGQSSTKEVSTEAAPAKQILEELRENVRSSTDEDEDVLPSAVPEEAEISHVQDENNKERATGAEKLRSSPLQIPVTADAKTPQASKNQAKLSASARPDRSTQTNKRLEELRARRKQDVKDFVERTISKEEYGKRKRAVNDEMRHLESEEASGISTPDHERLETLRAQRLQDIEDLAEKRISAEEYGKRKRSGNDQIQALRAKIAGKTPTPGATVDRQTQRLEELRAQRLRDIDARENGQITREEYGKRKRAVNQQIEAIKAGTLSISPVLNTAEIGTDLSIQQTRQELRQRSTARKAVTSPSQNIEVAVSSTVPNQVSAPQLATPLKAVIQLTVQGQSVNLSRQQLVAAGDKRLQQLRERQEKIRSSSRETNASLGEVNGSIQVIQQAIRQSQLRDPNNQAAQEELQERLAGFSDTRRSLQSEQMNLASMAAEANREAEGLTLAMGYVQNSEQPTQEMLGALAVAIPPAILLEEAARPESPLSTEDAAITDEQLAPSPTRVPLGVPSTSARTQPRTSPTQNQPMARPMRPLPSMQDLGSSQSGSRGQNTFQGGGDTTLGDSYEQSMARSGEHTRAPVHQGWSSPYFKHASEQELEEGAAHAPSDDVQRAAFLQRQKDMSRHQSTLTQGGPDAFPSENMSGLPYDEQQGMEQGQSQYPDESSSAAGDGQSQRAPGGGTESEEQARQRQNALNVQKRFWETQNSASYKKRQADALAQQLAQRRAKKMPNQAASLLTKDPEPLTRLIIMNVQMINKIWPKSKIIPPSKTYQDLITISLDAMVIALSFMFISSIVILMAGPPFMGCHALHLC